MLAASAALSLGSSMFGGRSVRRAAQRAEDQARQRQAMEQQYGRDALGRSQAMAASMPTSSFKPWNIRTGFGGWNIDPATGQATAQMDPRAQQYQDWNYGQSELARQQLGNYDRQGFAQQEFNRGQGLLAEGRQSSMQSMLGMLKRKGLSGFGQAGYSGVATNPLLNSMLDRQNRQDLELMDRSFGAADTQMDRLDKRASGLFDRGYQMNDDLNNQLEMNMRFGQQDYNRGMDNFDRRARFAQDQERYYQQAALGGNKGVADAQAMGNQARLSRDQGLARMGQNIGQSMFGGMFQQQPTAQPYNGTMWGGW
jgi:hypothetical protein